jgi:catechol 2,3-dioxygenase-like lactoylglutathione lyase family enzyme
MTVAVGMFTGFEAVVIRVRDARAAAEWYARAFGLRPAEGSEPTDEVVIATGVDSAICLRQLGRGETLPSIASSAPYPVFRVASVEAAHHALTLRGVTAGRIHDEATRRYFSVRDPDDNRIDLLQAL